MNKRKDKHVHLNPIETTAAIPISQEDKIHTHDVLSVINSEVQESKTVGITCIRNGSSLLQRLNCFNRVLAQVYTVFEYNDKKKNLKLAGAKKQKNMEFYNEEKIEIRGSSEYNRDFIRIKGNQPVGLLKSFFKYFFMFGWYFNEVLIISICILMLQPYLEGRLS